MIHGTLNRMARRNLWRHRRRTLITAISIGFGVMLSVTFTATGYYVYGNMIDSSAAMSFGHLSLSAPGYNLTPTPDKRLAGAERTRASILAMPAVDDAIVRIVGQGMFATASKSVGGLFMGVDPAQESPAHNLLLRSLSEGSMFDDRDSRSIVIGQRMAEKLNLRIGKKLVYTVTDVQGEIVSEIARVRGIFRSGVDGVDGGMVLLPIDRVRRTLRYDAQDASLIAVTLKDRRDVPALARRIRAEQPDAEVLTWRETQPDVSALIAIDSSANYLSQFLIGLLIAAGILNTMLMSVLERTREFGVMMAIGMSPRTLFRLVMTESAWMAGVGLLVGVLMTTPWYWFLSRQGLDFAGLIGDDYSAAGVLIDPLIRAELTWRAAGWILTGVFSLTMLSGLYPAWRAGRVPPVESLKTI